MLASIRFGSIAASLLIAGAAIGQAPATAPAGSTGQCRDGSYWTGPTKKGACRGHKGVQDWYGSTAPADATATGGAAAPAAASAPSAPAAPSAPVAAAPAPAAPAATAATAPKSGAPAVAQAPGGGPGLVWVNTKSSVYHCTGDRWYGKTKSGAYMSEADAIAKGNRADHGKACS